MTERARREFHGAKALVFVGADLVILERDHTPGIPWPGYLDLPGGGRDDGESPEACVLREIREEIGLTLGFDQLRLVHIREDETGFSFFFAAHLPEQVRARIVFGNEGAGWQMMLPQTYITHVRAIPHFAAIVADYMARSPSGAR